MMRGHWHVISRSTGDYPVGSIEAEHEAWHATGEPCLICGLRRYTVGTAHITPSGLPLAPCYGTRGKGNR